MVRTLILGVLTLLASSALVWNPVRDIERAVRTQNAAPVAALVIDASKARADVAKGKITANPVQLSELERRRREAEDAVLEEERKIRVRVEERAVAQLESELAGKRTFSYKLDRIASAAIGSVLYDQKLEIQPMVYENYVFLEVDPHKLESTGDSEAQLRLVLFWKRSDDRVTMRYAALEKRLRSPEPRLSNDPRIKQIAETFVESLGKTIVEKALP